MGHATNFYFSKSVIKNSASRLHIQILFLNLALSNLLLNKFKLIIAIWCLHHSFQWKYSAFSPDSAINWYCLETLAGFKSLPTQHEAWNGWLTTSKRSTKAWVIQIMTCGKIWSFSFTIYCLLNTSKKEDWRNVRIHLYTKEYSSNKNPILKEFLALCIS